jgi:chemotaxis regulatin CheY-phosphate phosphatase CheZ
MKIDHEALIGIKVKVNELQSLFKYGERVLPFLEDLLVFVTEITPVLNEMEHSLEESTNKIPKASDKLTSVTSQTEMATQEILDTVDEIVMKAMEIGQNFSRISDNNQQKLKLLLRVKKEFKKVLNGQVDEKRIHKIMKSIDRHHLNRANRLSTRVTNLLNEIQSMAMNIMMALQVQDITSQQLASVNHMISSIQQKIIDLLRNFSDAETEETKILLKNVAFDSDAMYEDKHDQQEAADKLIQEAVQKNSQKDIDELLNSNSNN